MVNKTDFIDIEEKTPFNNVNLGDLVSIKGSIFKASLNFNEYQFLKFTQEVLILAENNIMFTYKLDEKTIKDSFSIKD